MCGGVAGAVIGGEGDGGDEEEDAHGHADAVPKPADALRPQEPAGVGRGVHWILIVWEVNHS